MKLNHAFSFGNLIKNNKLMIETFLLILVLLFNSLSFYGNIQSNYGVYFSVNSSHNVVSPINNPSYNFEVYNHSVFSIDSNIITEYNFDQNFDIINSIHQENITDPIQGNLGRGSIKFTTNGRQSLVLQNYWESNKTVRQSRILELGQLYSKHFATVQRIFNISCSYPHIYLTTKIAKSCDTNDIEFLNSSILLVLQSYPDNTILFFYNIQKNETMQSIALPNATFLDYNYVNAPKNVEGVFLYFIDYFSHKAGFMTLNMRNNSVNEIYGENFKTLNTYKSLHALNYPLFINSRFLMFYRHSNLQNTDSDTYVWFSYKSNIRSVVIGNIILYLIVVLAVLIVFRKKWTPKLRRYLYNLNNPQRGHSEIFLNREEIQEKNGNKKIKNLRIESYRKGRIR